MPGGVSGGNKMAARLQQIAKNLAKASSVRVGFLEDQTYSDGTSLPMVAAINEYGAPAAGIPPRPFMRQTVATNRGHWGADTAAALKATDYDASIALRQMGEQVAGEVAISIVNFSSPPNSPKTIAKKGFDHPLIDSGYMRQHVEYEVK